MQIRSNFGQLFKNMQRRPKEQIQILGPGAKMLKMAKLTQFDWKMA